MGDDLESENAALRQLLAQAGIDAARLLKQSGIEATEHQASERLQRLLLEELHHRVKNTVATVMAIARRPCDPPRPSRKGGKPSRAGCSR